MDEYFNVQPDNPAHSTKVPEFYLQRLLQDSARVFKDSQGSVELLSWPKNAKGSLSIPLFMTGQY